jgi:hypothetical protein
MRSPIVKIILYSTLLILTLAVHFPTPLIAEDQNAPMIDSKRVKDLSRLIDSMDSIIEEINDNRSIIGTPEAIGREQAVRNRIDDLNKKLSNLETNFNDLASEVSLESVSNPSGMEFNWDQELKKILGPLIRELQRLTARPREIEKYRNNIATYDSQLTTIGTAVEHIQVLINAPNCPPKLKARLAQLMAGWENKKNEIETMKSIANLQLEKLRASEESLSKTVEKIPGLFFKSHGRNFLIAVITLILIIFMLYKFHAWIISHGPFKSGIRSFYSRVFDLSYGIFSSFICTLILLGVLYYFSDWVLLSLVLIFIVGLVWTSKAAIPRVWNQCRLILNLGPAREGELVVYNGVPYKITAINLYTVLQNPLIPSAYIRLPLSDLLTMRSRPVDKNEPWFPSHVDDWVLITSDPTMERVGQVIAQTPETVVIEVKGGARLSIASPNYLSSPPMNLSSGYRIRLTFGLSYSLQSIITTTVPEILREHIESGLLTAGFHDRMKSCSVVFKQAAASSLDVEIKADFSGDAAKDYIDIKCAIHRICVETCTDRKWEIPFQQITVHFPDKHS